MNRRGLFWGVVLVVIGLLALLDNLGLLAGVNVWGLIFPIGLILLGIWVLWGNFLRSSMEVEQLSLPLEGASEANIRLQHGAGRLAVSGGTSPNFLIEGDFGGGADITKNQHGDLLEIRLNTKLQFVPFVWWRGSGLDWDIRLSQGIPISLELETGASEARLDLGDLQVKRLNLKCGASSVKLYLPKDAGQTAAKVEAGAASIEVQIPLGVATRIRSRGGLSRLSLDEKRFPRFGDIYQSIDYDSAENKIDLDIQMGVGSVSIW